MIDEPIFCDHKPFRERIAKLEDFIRSTRPTLHYECEDAWYSCPKSEEGCYNEGIGDECNCGLEAKQAEIAKVLSDGQ